MKAVRGGMEDRLNTRVDGEGDGQKAIMECRFKFKRSLT